MKIQRTLSLSRILVALIIAALIFCLGVALGFLLDGQRIQWMQYQSQQQKSDYESLQWQYSVGLRLETRRSQQKSDYESLQWQYLFLTSSTDKNQTCVVLQAALEKSIVDLGASLDKIQSYKKESQINQEDYDVIERLYLINNLNYWLLASKTKKECGEDYITILYFFSEKSCPSCPDQGVILTYYKKMYQEKLLVFPINLDVENQEASIGILRNIYNISMIH